MRRLLEFAPQWVEPLALPARQLDRLAMLEFFSGRRDEALAATRQYLRAYPEEEDPTLLYTGIALWAGEYQDARTVLQRVQRTVPDDPSLAFQQAQLCGELADWPCATVEPFSPPSTSRQHWERLRRGTWCGFAWRLGLSGDLARYCDRAAGPPWPQLVAVAPGREPPPLSLDNTDAEHHRKEAWYQRLVQGYVYLVSGDARQALAELPTALLYAPDGANHPAVLLSAELRGQAQRTLGDLARSEQEYRRVLATNPRHPFALLGLGETLAAAGRRPEALAACRQVLATWRSAPDTVPAVRAAREQLARLEGRADGARP